MDAPCFFQLRRFGCVWLLRYRTCQHKVKYSLWIRGRLKHAGRGWTRRSVWVHERSCCALTHVRCNGLSGGISTYSWGLKTEVTVMNAGFLYKVEHFSEKNQPNRQRRPWHALKKKATPQITFLSLQQQTYMVMFSQQTHVIGFILREVNTGFPGKSWWLLDPSTSTA